MQSDANIQNMQSQLLHARLRQGSSTAGVLLLHDFQGAVNVAQQRARRHRAVVLPWLWAEPLRRHIVKKAACLVYVTGLSSNKEAKPPRPPL